jgi:hypothetical protein
MWGSTIVRVLAVLVLVGLLFGIGTAVYNAGVSAGITEAVQQAVASGEPAPVINVPGYGYGYGYGWGGPYWHGPGFFGILAWIFGIFLVFALLRAAFGWGRGGRHGGPGSWSGRRERMEELHRELHARDAATGERPAGA